MPLVPEEYARANPDSQFSGQSFGGARYSLPFVRWPPQSPQMLSKLRQQRPSFGADELRNLEGPMTHGLGSGHGHTVFPYLRYKMGSISPSAL
ncbi:hypothetical protein H4R24_000175 [Coemansia sp. RSA 988]|nr:hypothetical protein H4R24_000175 [Coemansia sp. RSA 988]